MDMYDIDLEKILIVDHEQLQFDKNSVCTLIDDPDKPDVSLLDNECFCINDDIFDIIQSTHQDNNIIWDFISNEPN